MFLTLRTILTNIFSHSRMKNKLKYILDNNLKCLTLYLSINVIFWEEKRIKYSRKPIFILLLLMEISIYHFPKKSHKHNYTIQKCIFFVPGLNQLISTLYVRYYVMKKSKLDGKISILISDWT